VLVGADKGKILRAIRTFTPEKERASVFGKVGASARIAKILQNMSDPSKYIRGGI